MATRRYDARDPWMKDVYRPHFRNEAETKRAKKRLMSILHQETKVIDEETNVLTKTKNNEIQTTTSQLCSHVAIREHSTKTISHIILINDREKTTTFRTFSHQWIIYGSLAQRPVSAIESFRFRDRDIFLSEDLFQAVSQLRSAEDEENLMIGFCFKKSSSGSSSRGVHYMYYSGPIISLFLGDLFADVYIYNQTENSITLEFPVQSYKKARTER